MSDQFSPTLDALDYSKVLDDAQSPDELRKGLEAWQPFVGDAIAALDGMDFEEFKAGLACERRGEFSGEAWADKYGAILLPELLIKASEISDQFGAPLGLAMNRMVEHGIEKFRATPTT